MKPVLNKSFARIPVPPRNRLASVLLMTIALMGTVVCAANESSSVYGNLVQNPGFETGDFTSWTLSNSPNFTYVSSGVSHSGIYGAALGSIGSLTYVSQNLTTAVGQNYEIQYWFASDGETPNEFSVSFGGSSLFDQTNIAAQSYTLYTFYSTATSSSTTLSFGGRDDPGYLYLDDISVVAAAAVAPVPASLGLVAVGTGGMFGMLLLKRRRKNCKVM